MVLMGSLLLDEVIHHLRPHAAAPGEAIEA